MDSTRIPPDELVAHAGFVRSLAFHLLRNDADADDAAQETLARAIAHPPERTGPVRPWLSGVLKNVVRRGARDSQRRERREARAAVLEHSASVEDFAAREQILRTVGTAVLALDEPQRVVVLLRHYEGLPPRDVAARLGVPVETVKSRLKRAHERLREALDEGRRGNVEGWRSSLALLVGADPRRGSGPESTSGSSASTIGGIAMAGKTVGMLAAALLVVVGGLVLRWRGAAQPVERPTSTASTHETATGPSSDARPTELAVSPKPSTGTPVKPSPVADAKRAEAPTSGPAAGWKRWTIGAAIQLDVPETWEHSGPPAESREQIGSWSTSERPWPNATIRFHRDGPEGYEKLLTESSVSATEQIQVSGRAATLRIFKPKIGPPGVDLKAILVTIDSDFGDGRPLAFFAASTKERFADFEPTYRAIVASVRLVASDAATGNEMPSPATVRNYEGDTATDVFEGVVVLGDLALPGGEARIGPIAKRRVAAIGADGCFRFDRVEAGELGHVEVRPSGMSPRELFLSPTASGTHRRVVLVVGRSVIEGRVFDRNGAAVANIPVRCMWRGRLPTSYADAVVVATTGPDGRYRADHLLPGRYQLRALVGKGEVREGLVDAAGLEPIPCDLGSPTPEATLSGVVRRVGGAIPGSGYLMFSSTDGKSAESTSYDADGRYSVRLAAGSYLVRVQLPAPARSVLLDAPVIVPAGVSTTELTLPSGRLRGRVIDAATQLSRLPERGPRNTARLCFQLQGGVAFQTDLCVQLADDGTFQLDYLAPGKYAVMSALPLAPGPDGKPRIVEVLDGGVETVIELEVQSK